MRVMREAFTCLPLGLGFELLAFSEFNLYIIQISSERCLLFTFPIPPKSYKLTTKIFPSPLATLNSFTRYYLPIYSTPPEFPVQLCPTD